MPLREKLRSGFLAAGIALMIGAPASGQEGSRQPAALSPAEALALDPGSSVTVRGVLKNAGSNYFTDQRLVITAPSDSDARLDVRAWMPAASGQTRSAPLAASPQAEFLDREVTLTGRVEMQEVKGAGRRKVLVVEKAEIAR